MTYVVVNSEVETWVSRERDPEDEWDAGDTDGRVSNVTAWVDPTADRENQWYHGDSIVKQFPDDVTVGTTLYAVVADYSSGSTFGRDGGHAQVLDAFTSVSEAESLRDAALVTRDSGSWRKDYDYSFTWGEHEYSRGWAGYFEHLNSLDIWQIVVKPAATNFLNPDLASGGYKLGR